MRGVGGEGGALVVRRVLHLEVPGRAALLAQVLLDRRPVVAHAPRAHLGEEPFTNDVRTEGEGADSNQVW